MQVRPKYFRLSPESLIILSFALANVLFHLLLPEYGYHRDEMYYVAIADGFSFANLDMPPVSPLYLKLFLVLFGHSLKVVHLAASVCGALVIVFASLIAKELGGRRYALVLTGTLLLWSGIVIFGSLYTYDAVSFVLWAAVLYLITRMLNGASQRLWLLAGLLLGLGMLTKLTILFLGLAIFLALAVLVHADLALFQPVDFLIDVAQGFGVRCAEVLAAGDLQRNALAGAHEVRVDEVAAERVGLRTPAASVAMVGCRWGFRVGCGLLHDGEREQKTCRGSTCYIHRYFYVTCGPPMVVRPLVRKASSIRGRTQNSLITRGFSALD